MILIYYLSSLLFYMSICGFCLNYQYYLKSLVMIEFIMVSVMVILMMGSLGMGHYVIYILIMSVTDGILGLLMLVLVLRGWGSDSYMLIDFII